MTTSLIPFNHLSSWPTGSRYICNPPPMDTDKDTVILVDKLFDAKMSCYNNGWDIPGGDNYDEMEDKDQWFSAKKTIDGVVENYIVMADQDRYSKWVTATELCKKLNLLNKRDRIAVFQVIVDGVPLF